MASDQQGRELQEGGEGGEEGGAGDVQIVRGQVGEARYLDPDPDRPSSAIHSGASVHQPTVYWGGSLRHGRLCL